MSTDILAQIQPSTNKWNIAISFEQGAKTKKGRWTLRVCEVVFSSDPVVFHTTEETVIIHTLQRHCPDIQAKWFQHFLSKSVVAMGTEVTPESYLTSESSATSSNRQNQPWGAPLVSWWTRWTGCGCSGQSALWAHGNTGRSCDRWRWWAVPAAQSHSPHTDHLTRGPPLSLGTCPRNPRSSWRWWPTNTLQGCWHSPGFLPPGRGHAPTAVPVHWRSPLQHRWRPGASSSHGSSAEASGLVSAGPGSDVLAWWPRRSSWSVVLARSRRPAAAGSFPPSMSWQWLRCSMVWWPAGRWCSEGGGQTRIYPATQGIGKYTLLWTSWCTLSQWSWGRDRHSERAQTQVNGKFHMCCFVKPTCAGQVSQQSSSPVRCWHIASPWRWPQTVQTLKPKSVLPAMRWALQRSASLSRASGSSAPREPAAPPLGRSGRSSQTGGHQGGAGSTAVGRRSPNPSRASRYRRIARTCEARSAACRAASRAWWNWRLQSADQRRTRFCPGRSHHTVPAARSLSRSDATCWVCWEGGASSAPSRRRTCAHQRWGCKDCFQTSC